MEPFEAAQHQFHRGQVIPLCVGWFGEIGRDFDQVVEVLVGMASSTDDGMSVSPLWNFDRKGGRAWCCSSNCAGRLGWLSFVEMPS